MNLEQARAKLADVMRSTGTKHPKVLVSELGVVVKFLLDEVDSIQSPCDEATEPTSVFPRKDVDLDKRPIEELPRIDTTPPGEEDLSKFYPGPRHMGPIKSRPLNPDHPHRKGNAGDAE